MPQVLRQDKIGTLSHSGGIITMAASTSVPAYLTIGGQQYKITSNISRTISTDVTMVANTLYMVYVVNNAGNLELRISANVNSSGPAGFSGWKLVGAFYANGAVTPAWGSFVTIEGAPTSGVFGSNFSLGGSPIYPFSVGNSTITSNIRRMGSTLRLRMRVIMGNSGMSYNTLSLAVPAAFPFAGTVGGGESHGAQCKYYDQSANADYLGSLYDWGSNGLICTVTYSDTTIARGGFTASNTPMIWTALDEFHIDVTYQVSGWTDTPLKDL